MASFAILRRRYTSTTRLASSCAKSVGTKSKLVTFREHDTLSQSGLGLNTRRLCSVKAGYMIIRELDSEPKFRRDRSLKRVIFDLLPDACGGLSCMSHVVYMRDAVRLAADVAFHAS